MDAPVKPNALALQALLERYSPWPLVAPAPGAAELEQVFDAALRAPDHGNLRPWRFVVVEGTAREALGEVFAQAARRRDAAEDGERFRNKAFAAPMIIALAARLTVPHKIPEVEQLLSLGAAAMNLLNALHLLGYGGFWATGANGHDPFVRDALGFEAQDRLLGFLYVGTAAPGSGSAPVRPARRLHVRHWKGLAQARSGGGARND